MNSNMLAPDTRDWPGEYALVQARAGDRAALIARSFERLTGCPLIAADGAPELELWNLPAVVVAHATEDDPVFFYANRVALTLFEAPARDFLRMPSRFSAEPMERDERARFMAEVTRRNIVTDYRGIRISQGGRLFLINHAIVWNLVDEAGMVHGQAATFAEWTPLPA